MKFAKTALILVILLVCNLALSAAIPALERQALIDLYNSTHGDAWTNKTGWKTAPLHTDGFAMPGTENTWYGVTTNANGVEGLYLQENNLTGPLPASFGNLINLNYLYIYQNHLSGNIPSGIGNLTNVYYLVAWGNQFTGSIPTELGNLSTHLSVLELSTNLLTGSIPASLGNLSNIHNQIALNSNLLTGSIPTELGNLSNMQYLELDDNQLTGSIPASLGKLNMLKGLGLSSNQLTGSIPSELGNLFNLTELNLSSNQLSGSILTELGNLPDLTTLRLDGNQLTGSIPSVIGTLTKLTDLRLSSNKLSGSIPTSLTNLNLLSSTQTNIGYNVLHTSDAVLITFLNSKDPDWASTQTIAPTNVSAVPGSGSVNVSWTPITYTSAPGGYRISFATVGGGPYTFYAQTANKNASSLLVTGLTPGSTYYFVVQTRTDVHAANQSVLDSEYSEEVSATTVPTLPTITTMAASAITETSAMSGGNVTSDGGAAVTARGVCVSTSANPTTANPHTHDGSGTGSFTTSLTSATPGTTYHIRAYATNLWGTAYGSDLTFTTLSLTPVPTVTTTAASSITATSALSGGNVTSEGSAAVTDRGVCVSTSANPTTANSHTHDGTGTGAFTSTLTSAIPGMIYHVRAYATNSWGTAYGDDVSYRMLGGTKSDFNGDGQEDLLWRNFNTGENYIWYLGYSAAGMAAPQAINTRDIFGDIALSSKVSRETGPPFRGKPVTIYRSFREGARPGKIVQTPREGLEALGQEQSTQTFSRPFEGLVTTLGLTRSGGASAPPLTDFNWKISGTGDFNSDGKADILLSNAVTGEIGVWYMNGGTRLGAEYLPTMTDMNWQIVGTGDFNGDAKPDILWRNSATGENGIWYMSGATRISADYLMTVTDLTWQIAGTGDFNGDGKTDILWRNSVSGESYVWCMDGVTRIGGIQPPPNPDTTWQIVATGDYNQDGNFDIVWRNTVSGENAVWYMNGGTRIGVEFLQIVTDLAWRIVNR